MSISRGWPFFGEMRRHSVLFSSSSTLKTGRGIFILASRMFSRFRGMPMGRERNRCRHAALSMVDTGPELEDANIIFDFCKMMCTICQVAFSGIVMPSGLRNLNPE